MNTKLAGVLRRSPRRDPTLASERGRAGFTIPEALFGLAIMGTMFITLYTGMTTGFQSIRRSRENLRATQILMERFETIRLYTWDQVNTPGFIPTNFTAYFQPAYQRTSTNASTNVTLNVPASGILYTGTVTIGKAPITEAYSNDLRQITVEVAWDSNGRLCRRSYSSHVARYGLQNYVY